MGESQATFRNNFDFLRILFASFVIISHSYHLLDPLAKDPFSELIAHTDLSTLGVFGFFVLSGYLIAQSQQKSASLSGFLKKRFRRIMPGLVVAVSLVVFVMGPLLSIWHAGAYLGSAKVYVYFLKTIFLLPTDNLLPGVFEKNPLPYINGSLWTLRYEVFCYLSICSFFIFRKQQRLSATIIFSLLLLLRSLHIQGVLSVDPSMDGHLGNILNLSYCFYAGVFLKVGEPWVLKYKKTMLGVSLALLLLSCLLPLQVARSLFLAVFPFFVLSSGLWYVKVIQVPAKIGDISYGTYIYAFPVQQALISAGIRDVNLLICLSLVLSWTAGFLSFHLVERKFLSRYKTNKSKSTAVARTEN
ncbi:MAG: acyltransferase [Sphingobacteriales bacterium]|nr:MAG: acyltransferase [Sphingobacteriales bacterium]